MKKLTAAQRKRLDKLATYLEGLPADYQHFDMSWWVSGIPDNASLIRYARQNGGVASCGTSACAAGHGPAAGILIPPSMRRAGVIDWFAYGQLFVSYGEMHSWVFGGSWERVDNHHYGAAARIRYLLGHGDTPESYYRPADKWLPHYAPYRIDAPARSVEPGEQVS